MQRLFGLTLAALILTSTGRADDASAARAVIDKAIQAAGGAEKLKKFAGHTFQEKGTYYGMGAGLPYTANVAVQRPGKIRLEVLDIFTIIVNGDKGWVKSGGQVMDMEADQLKAQQEDLYAGEVTSLAVLQDKAYTLAPLGESKVGDKPAVGVKVTHKGRQDVNLFFDKATHLLLKSEYNVHSREHGGKEVGQEVLYSDYKDVDGIQHATKYVINRDGKKFVESEVTDVKNVEKVDDKEFAKP